MKIKNFFGKLNKKEFTMLICGILVGLALYLIVFNLIGLLLK